MIVITHEQHVSCFIFIALGGPGPNVFSLTGPGLDLGLVLMGLGWARPGRALVGPWRTMNDTGNTLHYRGHLSCGSLFYCRPFQVSAIALKDEG